MASMLQSPWRDRRREGKRERGRSMTETEIQSGRGEKSEEINAKLRLPFHLGEGLK